MNARNKIYLILLAVIFSIVSQVSFAGALDSDKDRNHILISSKTSLGSSEINNGVVDNSSMRYLPYLQIGSSRFFNVGDSNKAVGLDVFVPLWQTPAKLIFADIRFYDRTGKPFEGNIHLGYRYLDEARQNLYGIYTAFDRKRTESGNYFSQVTFGLECWLNRFFMGGNFYQLIGGGSKFLRVIGEEQVSPDKLNKTVVVIYNGQYEKALGGSDAEIGYELAQGLIGYVGGYYFSGKEANTIYGPKARLAYDWSLKNGKKILGMVDKVGLETGVQRDKPRGTTWYLSANLKVGLWDNKNGELQGVARHMVDLVRRDVDVLATTYQHEDQEKAQVQIDPVTKKSYILSPKTGKIIYINKETVEIFVGQNTVLKDGGQKKTAKEKGNPEDKTPNCTKNPNSKGCKKEDESSNQSQQGDEPKKPADEDDKENKNVPSQVDPTVNTDKSEEKKPNKDDKNDAGTGGDNSEQQNHGKPDSEQTNDGKSDETEDPMPKASQNIDDWYRF